ncbi:hypothetical protein LIN78_16065 [Leeia sp. TBRC 13508]|uniref:Uncharacterized protein n=1 Tax=Leeia speluncae TaxID=2884804 RepID=A0ABS8DA29_9NEIS|nr:hypothetical protein [Leeia speluncae]MCB6185063.1 hypothetical protein [Leeia speluncae]
MQLVDQQQVDFLYVVNIHHHTCLLMQCVDELDIAALGKIIEGKQVFFKDMVSQTQYCQLMQATRISLPPLALIEVKHYFGQFLDQYLFTQHFACSIDGFRQVLNKLRHHYNQRYSCL